MVLKWEKCYNNFSQCCRNEKILYYIQIAHEITLLIGSPVYEVTELKMLETFGVRYK